MSHIDIHVRSEYCFFCFLLSNAINFFIPRDVEMLIWGWNRRHQVVVDQKNGKVRLNRWRVVYRKF